MGGTKRQGNKRVNAIQKVLRGTDRIIESKRGRGKGGRGEARTLMDELASSNPKSSDHS